MRNFKWALTAAAVAAVSAVVLVALDTALYPCTFMRNDVHAIASSQVDDLILGTSHGKMGIDPETMEVVTGRSGHNLCVGSEFCEDAYYLTMLAEEKQAPTRVIYEVDPGYFVLEKQEGNNYMLFYHEFPISMAKLRYFWSSMRKCSFRSLLFPWYEYPLSVELGRVGENLDQKLGGKYDTDSFSSDSQCYHESGFIERYPVDITKLRKPKDVHLFSEEELNQDNMLYLRKLIRFCREKGIEFVAVTTPIPDETLKDYPESFENAWDFFSDFFEEEGVTYLNFNREYYDAFTHNMGAFTDFDGHLQSNAARDYSRVLAQVLTADA